MAKADEVRASIRKKYMSTEEEEQDTKQKSTSSNKADDIRSQIAKHIEDNDPSKPENIRKSIIEKYIPTVDDDYISSFTNGTRDYMSGVESAYSGMSYDNRMDVYNTQKKLGDDLLLQSRNIRYYLEQDPSLAEQNSDFLSTLDEIDKAISANNSAFYQKSHMDEYDYDSAMRWKYDGQDYTDILKAIEGMDDGDEKDWLNDYVPYVLPLEEAQDEIEELEGVLEEYNALVRKVKTLATSSPEYISATNRMAEISKQYGGTGKNGIETAISDKKALMNRAKHIQEGITLSGAIDNDDFDQYSGYTSTWSDNWWDKLTGNEYDTTYEYINNQNGFRDEYKKNHRAYSSDNPWSDGESTYEEKGYDYMTKDQIAIYNYYYAKEGKEAAEKYLNSIQETLSQKKGTTMYENMEDKTLLEMAFGVAAGLNQFETGVQNFFNAKDDYIPSSATQIASSMVREDLADSGFKLPDWLGGSSLGQVGYDTITTTANMAPSILSAMAAKIINPVAGEIVGNALMYASSAGNAYQEALNFGYDKSQARAYSNLIGASETGLQYLLGGISDLGGKVSGNIISKMLEGIDNAFARTALKLGGNMLSEGFEEGLQEVLTPLFKKWTLMVDEDINWSEAAYSALLGALTAGLMEAPQTISGEVSTYRKGKKLQASDVSAQRLAEIGKTFSADTVAYQLAGRVNENTGAYTIGRLFNEIGATLSEQNVTDVTNALVAKGMDEKIARKNAKILAYVMEGGQLSKKQIAVLEANDVLSEVVMDTIINPNTTWYQRTNSYNEVLNTLAEKAKSPKTSQADTDENSSENAPAPLALEAPKNTSAEVSSGPVTNNTTEQKTAVQSDTAQTVETAQPVETAQSVETSQPVSADQSYTLSDGEEVRVNKIVSNEDGNVRVTLDNGQTVDYSNISAAPLSSNLFFEAIAKMDVSADDANILLRTFNAQPDEISKVAYARGIEEAFRYGQYHIPVEEIADSEFGSKLSYAQQEYVHRKGEKYAEIETAKNQAEVTEKGKATTENTENTPVAKKATEFMQYAKENNIELNERQEAGIKTMEKLSSALGLDMYIFESFEVDGQMKYKTEDGKILSAPNGIYYDNGKIYIDLNAGVSIKGLMHYTIAHELTHFIRQWSPEKFKILADYLMDEYGKREVSVSELIKNEQRKAEKKGTELDFDDAYEEVIAHSMEDILTSGHVEEFVTGIKQKDVNLWNKIKQWFQNLWTDLKAAVEAYKGFKPESVEGQIVSNMQDVIKDLEALFAQGLLGASDNYQAAKNGAEVKENTTTDSGVKYSPRYVAAYENNDILSIVERVSNGDFKANDKVYLENISAKNAEEIRKLTGISVDGFRVAIEARQIEHILKRHGANGISDHSMANPSDIAKMEYALNEPDSIVSAGKTRAYTYMKNGRNKTSDTVLYEKNIGDKSYYVVEAIPDTKAKTLFIVSAFIGKGNYKKEALQLTDAKIPSVTANTGSANTSTSKIAQQNTNVKEKFHLRESVEETKNLVALHNLTEDKLAKSLELGGFPMPSIAITKSDIPHTNFGDITLVFGKETIDPKASKKNTVYSADAWTPTFPQVEYEADRDVSAKISKKHSEIAKQYGYEFARPLYSSANYVEDELNRYGGEQGIVEHFANDTDMMQVFLADTGKTPAENVVSETVTRISDDKIAEYDFLISNLGKDVIGELTAKAGQSPLEARKVWLANYGEDLKEAFRQYLIADGMAETTANEAVKDMKPGSLIHEAIAARNYMRNGAETRKTSIDYSATRNAIKEAVNAEEYKAWLQDLYSGVEKDKGVYNQKDRYTTSGNLKSFKQTHLPYTLDGIVKAMASQNGGNTKNVSGFNGVKTLRAGTAERFSSIADMHKREGRLQHLTQEQADQISDELQNRTYELIDRVDKANSQKGDSNSFIRFDTIGEILMEIAESGSYNVSDIQSVFSKYSRAIGDDLAIEIKQLLFDISQMPVNIFEAKPERAVAFSEIKAAVLPNGTSQEVVNGLKQNGVPVMFYEQGNNEQRLERVNSVANAKFHMRGDPDVERVNRVLEKENAKLKEDVADLRAMLKLQRQVTNGTKFTKTSVEAAAKMLKKNMDAKGSTKELSGLLNTFYEYIASAKELSWEDVVEQAKPAAQWLLDNEKRTVDDSYARDILRELHGSKMYLDEQQRQEAAHQFGSYDEFRKKMMGTVWFVKEENGISMDSKWVELSESYPNLFPADTVSTDMPRVFAEAVDTLRNMTYEPEFSEQYNMPIQDVIYQVYDSYWRVNNLRTIADVKQGQINKLKAKHYERIEQIREQYKQKMADLDAEYREEIKEIRKKTTEKVMEKTLKREARMKIRKTIRDISNLLNKGNKQNNVKSGMRDFVADALKSAETLFTDTVTDKAMIRSGFDTLMSPQEEKYMAEAKDILNRLDGITGVDPESLQLADRLNSQLSYRISKLKEVFARERRVRNEAELSTVLGNLAESYAKLSTSEYSYISSAYNPDVYEHLKTMQENNAGVKINDMSLFQLQETQKAYQMVLHAIRTANKSFKAERSLNVWSDGIVRQFKNQKAPTTKAGIVAKNIIDKIGWSYEKPYYALMRIGSPLFTELWQNLFSSEDITMQDIREAKAFQEDVMEKYKYSTWNMNGKLEQEFVDSTGKTFQLTLGEIMSLYAYTRRSDALRHVEYGGFKFGKKALTDPNSAQTYKLGVEEVAEITDLLTTEQKNFVKDMQTYLSETMGGKGNEVSMTIYGVEMFGEKNYFPLKIAGEYKANVQEAQAKASAGFSNLANSGFTKSRNRKATAPIVLESFMEVWADHVNEMSRYHGAVPALEDIRRVMNYSVYSDTLNESVSMRAAIENNYGMEAKKYFEDLYREANSGAITDKMQGVSRKFLSLFRKNAVAYSNSVTIQQPASIYRAYAVVDPKYFGVAPITKGTVKAIADKTTKWKAYSKAYEEMMEYAPGVTLAKEIGGFDTSTGGTIRSYLLDTDTKWSAKTLQEKIGAVGNVINDNPVANLPNVADKIAWTEMWNACKRETADLHKELAPNSEAFMKKVGERFTEVIRATQVYDSVFSKSPMLKSKSLAVQYLVSFMNEPNTTANMVENAIRDIKNGNKKKAFQALAGVATSTIMTCVLKSLIYAMRDDDEDETFVEKYLDALTGGIIDDITVFNYIPIAKDVWSVMQGYDVDRPDMSIVSDAVNSLITVMNNATKDTTDMTAEELEEWDKKVMKANWNLVDNIAAFMGIPEKNIRREINAIISFAKTIYNNSGKTTWSSIEDTLRESIAGAAPKFIQANTESESDKLYNAIVDGDTVYAGRLKEAYKTDTAYETALKKGLRENDPRIKQAAEALFNGEFERYKELFLEVKNEGNFSFDTIMGAVNAEVNELEKKAKQDTKEESKEQSEVLFDVGHYYTAVVNNDQSAAKIIYDDLVAEKLAEGYLQHEAASAIASGFASNVKQDYMNGEISRQRAVELLTANTDKDETEVKKWDFELEYGFSWSERVRKYRLGVLSKSDLMNAVMDIEGEDKAGAQAYIDFLDLEKSNADIDITANEAASYFKYAEPAGISIDIYLDYKEQISGVQGDKDKNGKTISGSKKEKLLKIINSLPISKKQKDALYLENGWAESKLSEAPWH